MKKVNRKAAGSSPTKAAKGVGDTVAKKPMNKSLFWNAVFAALITHGDVVEGDVVQDNPAVKQAIEMWEINNMKPLENWDNAVEAAADFQAWIDVTDWKYSEPQLFTITNFVVNVAVPVKSGTLSVSMTIEPTTQDYKETIIQAHKMLGEFFNGAFSNGNKQLPAKSEQKTDTLETEEGLLCRLLRVQVYQDKLVAHVIPVEGSWTQYGIPLYKDVAKKFDIELPEEEGDYDIDWTIEFEKKPDGKPRRVVSITEN